LLLTGRDAGRLEALRAALATEGRTVDTVTADLARDEGRAAVIEAARGRPLDLLINNAGLGAYGSLAESAPEREREMTEVNVVTPVVLTRALLPDMLARARETGRRAGVIVLASTAAFMPLPFMSTYAATKAFDLHYAEGLAGELAREPVDVLALCPGATATRFFERSDMAGRRLPIDDAVAPERVAREGLAMLGKQVIHVVGGRNRLLSLLAPRLPRDMVRRGARSALRRGLKARRPA
jgi:short-subunit dehydrogenase